MSAIRPTMRPSESPFLRQLVTGIAGLIAGPVGAGIVDGGINLFGDLKSAFERFINPNAQGQYGNPTSGLPSPGSVWGGQYPSNASGSTQVGGISIGNAAFNSGLSPDQQEMLKNVKDPAQRAQMEAQFKMTNYQNLMMFISNMMRILGDISKSIVSNIR